jgi:hypothetical protein
MKGRVRKVLRTGAVIRIAVLAALVGSAITAQGAVAGINALGTTGFTCAASGSGFSDAHCKSAGGSGFSHVAIAEGETTEVQASNITTGSERSTFLIESKQAGIAMQIASKSVQGSGTMVNWVSGIFGEHNVFGEMTFEFLEASVTKPAGKGCKVKGGKIVTEKLVWNTANAKIKPRFEPAKGLTLASFEVEGCSTTALNGAYALTGTFTVIPNGATVSFTHPAATMESTLFLREQIAGIEGSLTFSARKGGAGTFTPLAFTTVETPI